MWCSNSRSQARDTARARSRDGKVVSERCRVGWGGRGQVSWALAHLAATAAPGLTKGTAVTTGR